MTSTDPAALTSHEADEAREAARFELIFQRPPTRHELTRFRRSHHGLLVQLPALVRRRAAMLIAR
jgi:hypothetical protein